MELFKYIILGLTQGITEPLPISSSGHLLIFKKLLKSSMINDLNFEIFLNFGSLIAIIFLFRKDITIIIKDFFLFIKTKKEKYYSNFKYALLIIIGTIPAGLIGFLFKDVIERVFSNVKFVGVSLLVTSLFLFSIRNIKGSKKDEDISFIDSLFIGLFQAVALLPGISRSGSTIVGGSLNNLSRESALKFSFLLYIPISLATMLLGILDFSASSNFNNLIMFYIIGTLVSAVATYFSAKLFIDIVKKGKLIYFVYYCLFAGIMVILFV